MKGWAQFKKFWSQAKRHWRENCSENEIIKQETSRSPENHETITAVREQSVAIREIAAHIKSLTDQIAGYNQAEENAIERCHTAQLRLEIRYFRWQKASVIVSGSLAFLTILVLAFQCSIMATQTRLTKIGLEAQITAFVHFNDSGNTITFEVTLTNSGRTNAENVILESNWASIPAGMADSFDPLATNLESMGLEKMVADSRMNEQIELAKEKRLGLPPSKSIAHLWRIVSEF
jgi:uncharacterized repeat protein (TIGR01451 family)